MIKTFLWIAIGAALIEAGVIAILTRALRITAQELDDTRQLLPIEVQKPPDAIIFDDIQAEDDERVKIYQGGLQNG